MMYVKNTIFLKEKSLILIDRRRLPLEIKKVACNNFEAVAAAIEDMVVQGAGDIAITAGYGLYLAALEAEEIIKRDPEMARELLYKAKSRLINTRPTGYHLAALLEDMLNNIKWEDYNWADQLLNMVNRAVYNKQRCAELTGRWASTLLEDGDCILTHCFPGSALLYMLKFAVDANKKVEVVSTETRPYLQGARLTSWSVSELGIPVTLITDNMAAYCMNQGKISKIFTAADRIALDGTVANKVGTFQLALAADYHKIPLYILGYAGPDAGCSGRENIPIELRDPLEVLYFNGMRLTGEKVKGFYPGFDLTPPELVSGIITDRGIIPSCNVKKYWDIAGS